MKKTTLRFLGIMAFVSMLFLVGACDKDDVELSSPEADFTAEPEYQNPLEVTFINSSTGAESFTWDFGDGKSVGGKNAWHLYDSGGQYTVTLTAKGANGITSSVMEKTISVEDPPAQPTADFNFTTNSENRFEYIFTSNTTSADSFLWDFGDGVTSTEENPTHVFEEGGTYTVEFTATGDERTLPADAEEVITIIPDPTATFTYEVSEQDSKEIIFTSTATDAETFAWDFGDGEMSIEENPVHVYAVAGDYSVTLTVTGVEGSPDAVAVNNVNVVYDPIVKISGTLIGHPGSYDGTTGLIDAAVDGDFSTFVDAPGEFGSTGYVGYDVGEGKAVILSSVKLAARARLERRATNGEIRGSNDPSLSSYDVLHTFTEQPPSGEFVEVAINSTESYRFVYYYTAPNGYVNIAEVEFHGEIVTVE